MPIQLVKCLAAFLVNRRYTLKVDGNTYGLGHNATSSVPQGSHVGPILFDIYCSDLMDIIYGTDVKLRAFADDSKFLRFIETRNDSIELQLVLDRATKWCGDNRLPINPNKTKHLSFSMAPSHRINTMYFIGSVAIEQRLGRHFRREA